MLDGFHCDIHWTEVSRAQLNAPEQQSVNTIAEFKHLFLAPGFLAYGSVIITAALVIIFFFIPKYGKKSMLW